MLAKLGRFVYDHRKAVLLVWLGIFLVGMLVSGPVFNRLTVEGESKGFESTQVLEQFEEITGMRGEVAGILDGISIDDPVVRREIRAAADEIATFPGVASVLDYDALPLPFLLSTDGAATLLLVNLEDGQDAEDALEVGERVADRLEAIPVGEITTGGSVLVVDEFNVAIEKDLQTGEMFSLPVAFVVMIFLFGGVVIALAPLMIGLTSVAGAFLVLFAATFLMDNVSTFVVSVITAFGIGLGIDYSLLLVNRFREERGAASVDGAVSVGESEVVAQAVERTVAVAGRTVCFSALTVMVSLLGLFVFEDSMLRSFAVGGAGVVFLALLGAITLLPALLGVWAKRIPPVSSRPADRGFFFSLARRTQRFALPVLLMVGAGLLLLAVPFRDAKFSSVGPESLPSDSPSRYVLETLTDRFPGRGADPVLVVAETPVGSAEVAAFSTELASLDGVVSAVPRFGVSGDVSILEVIPQGTSQGETAQQLVREIRTLDSPFEVGVTGLAAYLVDFKDHVGDRLPFAIIAVVVATFVLLFLLTGSLVVPLKAIFLNILSLGASFGALVLVFQEGNLSGLLGFEPVGYVDVFMPILILLFAFGLSMDYEVFLLSRVKEIYDETGDNDLSVALALQHTGRIITSAALLIVIVFIGFAAGEMLNVKQLGVGLALAVIVDATIVRCLVVPATMRLLGNLNWWAPAPLRRLHEKIGLSESSAIPPGVSSVDVPSEKLLEQPVPGDVSSIGDKA